MAKAKPAVETGLFDVPSIEEFEVQQFFDEIAPGVSIIHFHRLYNDGRRPQIGKALLDVIKEDVYEYIRSTFIPKYGGGKYLLIARGDGGKYLSSRVLEVDGGTTEPASASQQGSGNGAPGENLSFHDKLLLYNFIGGQKQQLDIGALMAGMASMMVALRPAETSKPMDPLAMFQAMMELYKSNKPPEKNSLQEIREVASVIKEFSGDGGKDVDSMWGAVANIGKDAVDKLAPILTGFVPGAPRPAVPGPAVPIVRPTPQIPPRSSAIPPGTVVAGAPAVATPPVEAKEPEPVLSAEDNLRRWLAVQIGFLKEKCAKVNKDPEFWAAYIFENEEEPGCSALLYAVRQGATLDNLLAFDAEIAQTPQLTWWFSQLYEHVKLGLQDDLDTGGPGGNTGDDKRDAAPFPTGPTRAGSNGAGATLPDSDIH